MVDNKTIDLKNCALTTTLSIIGGKWKPVIIHFLALNPYLRFGELRREIPNVTQRMLTQQLRELEADNIITRKVYAQVPPRVDYALTEHGKTLLPIMLAMRDWGANHMDTQNEMNQEVETRNAS